MFFSTGCMRSFFINGEPIDPSRNLAKSGLSPGCPAFDRPDPCKEINCENGFCRALDYSSFTCDCHDGYMGEMCDQRKSAMFCVFVCWLMLFLFTLMVLWYILALGLQSYNPNLSN